VLISLPLASFSDLYLATSVVTFPAFDIAEDATTVAPCAVMLPLLVLIALSNS